MKNKTGILQSVKKIVEHKFYELSFDKVCEVLDVFPHLHRDVNIEWYVLGGTLHQRVFYYC